MRYKISPIYEKPEERMGNLVDYDTAHDLLATQNEPIYAVTVGEDPSGKKRFRYNTGLSPEPINRNQYIPKEQKPALLDLQKKARLRFAEEVLGDKKREIDDTNGYIWTNPLYGSHTFTNETARVIHDTNYLPDLLLYLQVMCGSYQLVAVNKDEAQIKDSPYFIEELVDAEIREAQEDMDKVTAIGKLYELQGKGDNQALLYLCWQLGETGFNTTTPGATMVAALYKFIMGETREKAKKQTVKEFAKAFGEYQANRDAFMIKAIIRIADYYSILSTNRNKVLITKNGDEMGKTVEEAATWLAKPANRELLEELQSEVSYTLNN